MSERSFRTLMMAIAAVILGVEVIVTLLLAYWTGSDLHDRRWGWSIFEALVTARWTHRTVQHMQSINEHGILGPSPWDRDRE